MILCSGCFDGLHAGHTAYLEAAAEECGVDEPLMVAVAPDPYIREHKGRDPYWPLDDRMEVIRAIGVVDHVVAHQNAGAANIIRQYKPRIFAKGIDWEIRGLPDDVLDACHHVGTHIIFLRTERTHTSEAHG